MLTGAAIAAAFWGTFGATAPPEGFLISSQFLGHLQAPHVVPGSPTIVYILRDLVFHVSPAMCFLVSIPMCPDLPFYVYLLATTLNLYDKTPHKLIITLPHLTLPMLVLPSVSIGRYFI